MIYSGIALYNGDTYIIHMIATVLLIAPLNVNFATQLQLTKHGTTICHNIYQALTDSLEKTIVIGHQ